MPWSDDTDVFVLALSLSFGGLGAVLLYRKFDVYYGSACLLTAAFGLKYPALFIIPYFFVVWRVFVGRSIRTDAKLLIGQRRREAVPFQNSEFLQQEQLCESQTSSNSLAHWIVALDEGNDKYCITHAVGEVVSGKGKKMPYKDKERGEVEKRYVLHHVGWVTRKARKDHMEEVKEKERMESGNSCQEYAVDLAFQLSCSRTYTFMRLVTLIRWRTAIYLILLVVFSFHILANKPLVVFIAINPYIFNPFVITNIFIATEANRLGYTNLRQEKYWWDGLKDRLKVYFKVISYADMFKLCLILLLCVVIQMSMNNIMITLGIMMMIIVLASTVSTYL